MLAIGVAAAIFCGNVFDFSRAAGDVAGGGATMDVLSGRLLSMLLRLRAFINRIGVEV